MESKTIDGITVKRWSDNNGFCIETGKDDISKLYIEVSKKTISRDTWNGSEVDILKITDSMGDEHEFINYINPSELQKALNMYNEYDIETVRKGSIVAIWTNEELCVLSVGYKSNELDKLNEKYFSN